MSKKTANREVFTELVVGAFVALVFLGLAVFTIVISGKNLFNDEVFGIEVVLPDAMGLRPNDPVIARGTTVGVVTDVRYDEASHKFQKKTRQLVFKGSLGTESGWTDVFYAVPHSDEHTEE